MENDNKTFDVVIVGAGLSGIGAAYHLQEKCPHINFTILEGRASLGGTWDLFKYPGIRSDSDMYTFGFNFHPWKNPKAIADGAAILDYIHETADKFSIREKIQFNRKVVASNWNSENSVWEIEIHQLDKEETEMIYGNFLFMCSGYYDYQQGYLPKFPNITQFKGAIMHPQHWDDSYDYLGKDIVIIGSGATAITLLPALSEKAKSVTMLQRSPTFIMNRTGKDAFANFLKEKVSVGFAHKFSRWKNILLTLAFYQASKKWPDKIRKYLKGQIEKELGDLYVEKDFDPKYNPWDQRLCVVPNNDMFDALKSGKGKIVTDTIETFDEEGVVLTSGKKLKADLIVTATGLKVQLLGGMKLQLNGADVNISKTHTYRGVLLSGVPNFGINLGYTNASWTLKSDLNCQFVARVLNHMKQKGATKCTPMINPEQEATEPLLDLQSNYILRADNVLPKQGVKAPWRVHQNHIKESLSLKFGSIEDQYLVYE